MGVKATAASAAQAWSTNFAQSGPKYTAGINSVKVAPGQLAAAAADNWAANVAASKPKFAAKVGAVTLSSWQQSSTTVGVTNLATGAQKGAPKVAAFQQKFLPVLTNIVDSLPAGGNFGARMARFQAYANALHAQAGNFS